MSDWYILRTSPVHTIALAEALCAAGIEAWTPTETVKPEARKQEPWEKPIRPRKVTSLVTRAMIPTFVFADATRLSDLARMSHSPATSYTAWDDQAGKSVRKVRPFFTLFAADRRPIPDRHLAALKRIAGRRRKPRGDVPAIKAGDHVRLTEGAYEGLRGEVLSVSGKKARVRFPGGHFDFEVYVWLLKPDVDAESRVQLNGGRPEHIRPAA